jgi:CDGSH-type Zn-finger protein
MPRIVKLYPTGPIKIEPGSLPADKPTWICACGLSKKMPFCDGSHKITRQEQPGMVYVYSQDGQTVVETRPDDSPEPGAGPAGGA